MAAPDVKVIVQDGGLGIAPTTGANVCVKIGVCSSGVPSTMYGFSDAGTAQSVLGVGPLVEAIGSQLEAAGGPVYAMPANPSQAGSVSSATLAGAGPGTVTPSLAPFQIMAVKIGTGGSPGTATYTLSINGGAYGNTIYTTPGTPAYNPLPGTLSQIEFPAGTYVANDVWTWATTSAIPTVTGTGSTAPLLTAGPVGNYKIQIKIVTSGALGTASFQYSLDNGVTWSVTIIIPSGGVIAIPGTGIVLAFASTFTSGDIYTFTSTAPGYNTTDLTNAMTALLADPTLWGWVDVVGMPSNAAGAAAMAAIMSTKMTAAFNSYRFARSIIECPSGEGDTAVKAAFASFADPRVAVACGDANMVSTITGTQYKTSPARALSNRLGKISPGEDPAWVGRGALSQVVSLVRDETATPGLDDQRFTTLRKLIGEPGFYITNARLMSQPGSDFTYFQHGRVMDVACTIARRAMLPYLNGSVRVDPQTGFIDPRDAKKIEQTINAAIYAGLVATGDASASTVTVSRTTNIISTSSLPVTVAIVPLGYMKFISITIGFQNPAIAAAA